METQEEKMSLREKRKWEEPRDGGNMLHGASGFSRGCSRILGSWARTAKLHGHWQSRRGD